MVLLLLTCACLADHYSLFTVLVEGNGMESTEQQMASTASECIVVLPSILFPGGET